MRCFPHGQRYIGVGRIHGLLALALFAAQRRGLLRPAMWLWLRPCATVKSNNSLGSATKGTMIRRGLLYRPRQLLRAMPGCKHEIAVVVELGDDDGMQTKTLRPAFHTLAECSHCHERHLYDYSDIMIGQDS